MLFFIGMTVGVCFLRSIYKTVHLCKDDQIGWRKRKTKVMRLARGGLWISSISLFPLVAGVVYTMLAGFDYMISESLVDLAIFLRFLLVPPLLCLWCVALGVAQYYILQFFSIRRKDLS